MERQDFSGHPIPPRKECNTGDFIYNYNLIISFIIIWKIKNKTFFADAIQPMVGQEREGQNQGEIKDLT